MARIFCCYHRNSYCQHTCWQKWLILVIDNFQSSRLSYTLFKMAFFSQNCYGVVLFHSTKQDFCAPCFLPGYRVSTFIQISYRIGLIQEDPSNSYFLRFISVLSVFSTLITSEVSKGWKNSKENQFCFNLKFCDFPFLYFAAGPFFKVSERFLLRWK